MDTKNLTPEEQIRELKKENESLRTQLHHTAQELAAHNRRGMTALSLGDAIQDGICIISNEGFVKDINKGYTEITGIEREAIVGRHVQDLLKEGLFTQAVSPEVIRKKKKVSAMTTIHSNGKQVLIVGNPFFDENGNVEEVLTVMRDLTELIKLKEQLTNAEREREEYEKELMGLKKVTAPPSFVGEDASIKRVRELIDYVATTDATVLITGETGAGKEVISREIYSKSKRKDGPYVKVNCAAIPENLLESELFGYVKGAFTGADKKDKVGLFEVANGGTILLDEISEMPLKLQTKLLRVLQEREIVRVGDTKSIKIDVRVIAATNQALEEQIRRGLFREDLYYRLNVFPIQIPPLRQRKSDIALLANSFLIKYNALYEKNKIFTPGAIRTLTEYEWPGNVRELENIVERLVIVRTENAIEEADVRGVIWPGQRVPETPQIKKNTTLKEAVRELEKTIIEQALKEYGSSYKAAEVLGIAQPTVVRKAQACGIKLKK
ncbi:MAG: PAS domain S-box protein [Clostridiales bacterium]|nr:PAS domain S-box protein [Clostridiales bacterium]